MVFSGVLNSVISPNSLKSLITLYKDDRAIFPLDNLRIWSMVRGRSFFSSNSRTKSLGFVTEAFLELRSVLDCALTETIR